MNSSLTWSIPTRRHNGLIAALSIALGAHLILLSIHFAPPERPKDQASLPVVQIDLQTVAPSPPPKTAEMIAERDQRAADLSRAEAPTTSKNPQPLLAPPVIAPPPVPAIPEPAPEQEPPTEQTSRKMPDTPEGKSARASEKAPTTTKPTPSQPKPATPPETAPPATTSLTERSLQMARINTELLKQSLRDDVAARSAVLTANTRYGPEAAYMNAWVNKVETLGNQNYPDEARRKKLSGRLVLEVKLDYWGSVLDIRVRQSSGQPILDEAAINIVRMGEPYARFPREMREKLDSITIIRTWAFGPSGVNTR